MSKYEYRYEFIHRDSADSFIQTMAAAFWRVHTILRIGTTVDVLFEREKES